jgi:hypothetical protein
MNRFTSAAVIIVFWLESLSAQSEAGNAQKSEDRQTIPTSQVVIKEKPDPEKQSEVSGTEINATVVLRAIFTKSGKVTDIKLVKVIPQDLSKDLAKDIAKRCKKAAQKIKFSPATRDGNPVSVYVQLEYNFHLY